MRRERLYAATHRGLRNLLAQFSLLAGKTDYGDRESVGRLKQLGGDLFLLLDHHFHAEDEHLLAFLEERVKGAAIQDRREHEELTRAQHELVQRIAHFDGHQDDEAGQGFYLAFTGFQGHYLAHLLHEELVTEKLLLNHYSDVELERQGMTIVQRVSLPVLLLSVKYIVPAQSPAENLLLLAAFRAHAPPSATRLLLDTLRTELDPDTYAALFRGSNSQRPARP